MAVKTEKLVRMAQRGDREAFVCLMEAHKLSMSRTALAVLHNEEDAADAIGDTVLTAFTKLCTLREPKYFKTWLTRVLLCNCYSILRLRRLLGTVKSATPSAYNDHTLADGVSGYRGEDGFFLGGKVTNPDLAQERRRGGHGESGGPHPAGEYRDRPGAAGRPGDRPGLQPGTVKAVKKGARAYRAFFFVV